MCPDVIRRDESRYDYTAVSVKIPDAVRNLIAFCYGV